MNEIHSNTCTCSDCFDRLLGLEAWLPSQPLEFGLDRSLVPWRFDPRNVQPRPSWLCRWMRGGLLHRLALRIVWWLE